MSGLDPRLKGNVRVDRQRRVRRPNLGDKSHEQKKIMLVEGLNELTYGLLLEIGHELGQEEQERLTTDILNQGPPPGTMGA